jgi:hypothetical protein
LQLLLNLSENTIDEEEFNKELEQNPENYIVDINYLSNPSDLMIITDIVKKIGKEFTVDEVSEIFSIESEDIINNTKTLCQ